MTTTTPAKTKAKAALQPDAPAAAAAETAADPQPKTIDFRGLALTAPPVLPGELLFDLAALEDEDTGLTGMIGVLRSIFGRDQIKDIRAKIREDGLDLDATLVAVNKLIDDATGAYGMESGEADASDAS